MNWLAVVSFALLIGALAVAPATATAQSAGADSVSGDASECLEFFEPVPGMINCARRLSVNVEVASGPAGEHPTGTVQLLSTGTTPGGTFTAITAASCLAVSEPVAIIGVTGKLHQGGAGVDFGMAGLIRVTDAGGPNSGLDTVEFDYQTGEDPFAPPLPGPTTCSSFPTT